MYPSLPAAGPSTLPQEPQSTGMSSQTTSSAQQYPYSPMQHMQPQPNGSVQPYAAYAQPDSQSRQMHSPTQQRVASLTPGELAPNAVGYAQQQQEAAMTAAAAAAAVAPSSSGSHAGHWSGEPRAQSHSAPLYGHPQYVSTPHSEYAGVASNVSQPDARGSAAAYPVYDYAQFAPQAQPVHGNGVPPSTSNPGLAPMSDAASPSVSSSQADLSTFQRMMSPSSGTKGGLADATSPSSAAGGVLAGPGGVKVTAGIGAHGGVYEPGQGPPAQPFANSSGSAEYSNANNQNHNTAATLASLPSAPTTLPNLSSPAPEWQRPVAVPAEAPALIDL